jgi:hypothetical protein
VCTCVSVCVCIWWSGSEDEKEVGNCEDAEAMTDDVNGETGETDWRLLTSKRKLIQ